MSIARPIHRWLSGAAALGVVLFASVAAMPAASAAQSPMAAGPLAAVTQAVECGPAGDVTVDETPWPLQRLVPSSAWALTRGGRTTVAVIDSGVSATHPVLQFRVRPGRDYVDPAGNGQCDEAGHGTLVAGIIAGEAGYGPFTGIAPNASILPVRVVPDAGRVYRDLSPRVADAIRWSVDAGADVINLSLSTDPTPELAAAVEYARARDVVIVAAAGNVSGAGSTQVAYPAAYEYVLAVAGVDEFGRHVDSSISGGYVDLAAPGVNIVGPAPRGGYVLAAEGGTSFAAAYVSGAAALVRSYFPTMSATEVIDRLIRTADPPPEGYTEELGFGVVNPYRALATVFAGAETAPPAAADPLPPILAVTDPLADEKRIAAFVALGGVLVTLAILVGGQIVRRGRSRGWRPGERA